MEKPIITYLKNAEKSTNKIRIPLEFIKKNGHTYYMEIHDNYIILKPTGAKDGKSNGKY